MWQLARVHGHMECFFYDLGAEKKFQSWDFCTGYYLQLAGYELG